MGIKDELKKMTSSMFGGSENTTEVSGTNAPGTESVSTDAPATNAPTTEIPEEFNTEIPPTDAPKTELPSTNAPTTEVPDDSAIMKAEMELLKSELEELKNPKKITTDAPSTDAPISEEDFMKDVDFDELLRDPEKFNKLLNSVYKKGIQDTRDTVKAGSKGLADALPDMINRSTTVIQTLEKTSEDFYTENKELKPFKKIVAAIFGEIATANPNKSYADNLTLTGDEVRKRLDLTKEPVTPKIKDKKKPPKLPKSKGQHRTKPTEGAKGMTSEIDDMNKAINS